MKSSTFTIAGLAFVAFAYVGMAVLESNDTQKHIDTSNIERARKQCGNADWEMEAYGHKIVVTCIRRKPLNGSRVKP